MKKRRWAVGNLRERAQNEATFLALRVVLDRVEAERDQLKVEMAKLDEAIAGQHGTISELLDENAKLRAELERWESDGWKLVPVEPTEEMLESDFISCHCGHDFSPALFDHVWHKMLAAAPSAPKADDPAKVQLLKALEAAEKKLCIAEYHLDKGEDDSVVFESEILQARAAIAAARQEGGEV